MFFVLKQRLGIWGHQGRMVLDGGGWCWMVLGQYWSAAGDRHLMIPQGTTEALLEQSGK